MQNGFNNTVLPSSSPYIGWSYNVALQLVNKKLQRASWPCGAPPGQPTIYTLCVYSLACSNLLQWAQDQSGQTFFNALRDKWNLDDPISGVIQSTGDNGTNESLTVPDQMKNFTIQNLQNFKDPYGRWYLGQAQAVGTLWGLS